MSGEPTNIRRAMSGDFPEIERLCVSHGLDANRHLHFAANLDRSLVLTDASGKVVAAITDYPVSVAAALLLVDFEYLATQQGWEEVRCFILENFKAYRERGLGGALLMLETALGKEIGEKIPQELATVPKQGGLLHLAVFTHNGSDVPSLVN